MLQALAVELEGPMLRPPGAVWAQAPTAPVAAQQGCWALPAPTMGHTTVPPRPSLGVRTRPGGPMVFPLV